MEKKSTGRGRRPTSRLGLALIFVMVLLLAAGTATAAQIADDQIYRLSEGQVITDDLIVSAEEVVIDGTVEGDLVAFARTVTINGNVTEDVIAAGAEVQINGVVGDDVRAAGAAVRVEGRIGDDLFMAGGAFVPGRGPMAIPMGDTTIYSGLFTGQEAVIGGDAYLAGGYADLSGLFRGDLRAAAAQLEFDAEVEGDAYLEADSLSFGDGATVTGKLTYTAPSQSGDVEAGGGVTEQEPPEESAGVEAGQRRSAPLIGFGWWLMRTVLITAGVVLVGLVLLALGGGALRNPVGVIEHKPLPSALYGLLAALAAIPLSAALIFLAALFFGWFRGGLAASAFSFGFLLLAWMLSPAVTGLWLGRRIFAWTGIKRGDALALALGAAVIVLSARMLGAIPCTGVVAYLLIYLASFALAAGGVLTYWFRGSPDAEFD